MKTTIYLTLTLGLLWSCSEVSKEKRPMVNRIEKIIDDINANHRTAIIEDDFHEGDSVYKIRGYFMDDEMLKVVGVLHTSHIERDDYFYFENNEPIYSGHLVVQKDDRMASEYKYYYGEDGYVDEALFWSDHYKLGRRFPIEHFREFEPDKDSLRTTEEERLKFFLDKLEMEGFEIVHLNENLDANSSAK
ncbi:MAG: hypothetical protein JXR10_15590 [Cyclobacteriaceae bacterium]